MLNPNKSVLLNTSSYTDVQYVGGEIQIQGLEPIKKSRVVDFSQINYRAEVVQVVTIGATAYVPTSNTKYTVLIGDPARRANGQGEFLVPYSYTTGTVTGVAATDRETIHAAIVAKINAVNTNWCVAASLGGGNGFTITDDAGYYPYNRQGMTNRMGANIVKVVSNDDGTGFATTNIVNTTAAVYAVGVGATLLNNAPVYDLVTGNLISGEIYAPKTVADAYAVSGQKYNMFSISYLAETQLPTIAPNYKGFALRNVSVWVDNGAGTSTTNLAGYISFERAMHRGIADKYRLDPSAQIDFLDNIFIFQGASGAAPTGTTGDTNKMVSDAKWNYFVLGAGQTLTTPTPGNSGLILDQDLAAAEGSEYTPSLLTNCPKEFVVGSQDIHVFARISATTWANAAWFVALRTKAAYSATFAYSNLVSVGTLAASPTVVSTQGILASAALVATSTGVTLTNSTSNTVEIIVNKAGAVTCKLNDVVYPVYSAGTTPLVFAAGTILVPSLRYVQVNTSAPVLVAQEFMAVPSTPFKI